MPTLLLNYEDLHDDITRIANGDKSPILSPPHFRVLNKVSKSSDSLPQLLDLADIELGKEYELVISTYACLCRYRTRGHGSSHEVLDQCCLAMEECLNSVYRQSRVADNSIGPLEIRVVKNGTFEELMDYAISQDASINQYKVPSLCRAFTTTTKSTSKRNRCSWNCGNTAHECPSLRTFHPGCFAGNYGSLLPRDCHELGHGALNDAIRNLYYEHSRQSQRIALLVIIQMVPEAVRIRYIEHLIRRNMLGENLNFIPDAMARSMENVWSALSKQIQWSTMLYHCNPRAIRMPVPVVVRADQRCPYVEPTTNIIGRDGQCMDVKDNQYNNGNAIILWACGNAQPCLTDNNSNDFYHAAN
ncbi:auxin-responsive GH3 family protein [Artemisia annua]|uniref:rRNA N-glycosylase n=1 Tax=Artemisia annua TaxID=35608 RepID=A0A2U1PLN9_ARTAN|nr:auxin-responsive GH3 family protein [Artemisia annua]